MENIIVVKIRMEFEKYISNPQFEITRSFITSTFGIFYLESIHEGIDRIKNIKKQLFDEIVTSDREHRQQVYLLLQMNDFFDMIERKFIVLHNEYEEKNNFINDAESHKAFINMIHEVRTPLNLMLTVSQLLSRTINMENEIKKFKIIEYLNVYNKNLHRIIRTVNNIVEVVKIETGDITLDISYNDIVEVVEDIVQDSVVYFNNNNMELIFDTNVEELYINIDLQKIRKIIVNLISNAVKYTGDSKKIYVGVIYKNFKTYIKVRDNGVGISLYDEDTIFEKFTRGDLSLSRPSEGSGLGLFLVKNFVELHGGSISFKSCIGQGSEFIIEIPEINGEMSDVKKSCKYIREEIKELIEVEYSDIY